MKRIETCSPVGAKKLSNNKICEWKRPPERDDSDAVYGDFSIVGGHRPDDELIQSPHLRSCVGCTVLMYAIWWRKPQNVNEPVIIHIDPIVAVSMSAQKLKLGFRFAPQIK